MTENIPNIVITSLLLGVGGFALVGGTARFVRNHYAPVKTVHAVVTDKHKVETFSKYSGNGKREKYVIVFTVDGKKKSFYVSQFSYNGYRINETGQLTYKGDNIIEFR